jgi:quercetin dioxygenase-like cupin family protein
MKTSRDGEAMNGEAMGSGTTAPAVVVRDPGEGPATWALGSLFEHLVTGAETGSAFGLTKVTQPAGAASPVHLHTREAEAFYLLDGTMRYLAGEQTYELRPGSFIYLPTGVPHAFRVTGETPVSFLAVVAPGGLMAMYDEVGRPAAGRRLPGPDEADLGGDIQRWLAAGPGYGLQVIGPPLPA